MLLCLVQGDLRVPVAAQQIARVKVADGQRKAVLSVLQPELFFVVSRPDVVGLHCRCLGTPPDELADVADGCGQTPAVPGSKTPSRQPEAPTPDDVDA